MQTGRPLVEQSCRDVHLAPPSPPAGGRAASLLGPGDHRAREGRPSQRSLHAQAPQLSPGAGTPALCPCMAPPGKPGAPFVHCAPWCLSFPPRKVPIKRTMSCWWRTEGTASAAGGRPQWGPLVPIRGNPSAVELSGVLWGHWPLRKCPGGALVPAPGWRCCPPASCPPLPPTSGPRGGGHPQHAGLEGAGALSSRRWPGQCRGVGQEPGCQRRGDRPARQHPVAETLRRGSRPPRAAKRATRLLRRRTCGHPGSWAVSVTQKMSWRWPVGVSVCE